MRTVHTTILERRALGPAHSIVTLGHRRNAGSHGRGEHAACATLVASTIAVCGAEALGIA